ncbi:MAG: hypothetical protein JW863_00260 [Chitinispirillaceae bacterium]|nr:hypothetical protein [Chitinispirillaceae bacterium]
MVSVIIVDSYCCVFAVGLASESISKKYGNKDDSDVETDTDHGEPCHTVKC